jgi:hypothetical protein
MKMVPPHHYGDLSWNHNERRYRAATTSQTHFYRERFLRYNNIAQFFQPD